MAKYGKKAQEKVEENVREMKEGKLRSGSGKKVTSRKQAIAIGLSEARKAGGKAPKKKTSKKSAGKKTAAKKTSSKKASPKTKTSAKKKTSSKKAGAKKTAAKKKKTSSRKK